NNGFTIGIIPQDEFSFANGFCDVVICTGIGFARDFMIASSADGIIAIGGGVGTLIEMAAGYMIKKSIVVIAGSGGVADTYAGKYLDERNRVPILVAKDARSAVQIFYTNRERTFAFVALHLDIRRRARSILSSSKPPFLH